MIRAYQQKGIDFFSKRMRAVDASDIGTGKTRVAIEASKAFFPIAKIVICPASAKISWETEIRKWEPDAYIRVIQNRRDIFGSVPNSWLIFSYEMAVAKAADILSFPIAFLLICDEAHYLQSLSAKRTKVILGKEGIARKALATWFISGSFIDSCPVNFYAVANFCLRGKLGKFKEFAERYAYSRPTDWGIKYYGQKNLPELMEKVKPILHRITLEEALPELPEYEEIQVPLEMTARLVELQEEYEANREEIERALAGGFHPPKESSMSKLRKELGAEKIGQAYLFVKDLLDQGQSLIIFTHHQQVTEYLTELLSADYSTASIYGPTLPSARKKHVENFQAGNLQCLVLSIQAAGISLTLTKAHIAVFVEFPWTAKEMDQAMGRIRRLGQKNFCIYYHLVVPNSLDEVVLRTIKAKHAVGNKFWNEFEGKVEQQEEIVWD